MLIVAQRADAHANMVSDLLARLGVATLHLDSSAMPTLTWDLDGLKIDSRDCSPSSISSIWWRRNSRVAPKQIISPGEAELAVDEITSCLRGIAAGPGIRVVDPPELVAKAEEKLYTLRLVRALGYSVPRSIFTNDPHVAYRFLRSRRSIAKPISSGYGLAPQADEVDADCADLVATCPVLLQDLVDTNSDLRVVTVGAEAFVWQRVRQSGTIDWRREDPSGRDFVGVSSAFAGLSSAAVNVCSALGLSVSVQDWLLDRDGRLVFLEVNPQGQWLFLTGSDELVAPAFARHLTSARGGVVA